MKESKIISWDTETYYNFHLQQFYNPETDVYTYFEISKRKNEIAKIRQFFKDHTEYEFLNYNGLAYDLPLTRAILKNNVTDNKKIKQLSDRIIKGNYIEYNDKFIDLYKIGHYDNQAKASSLKWLQAQTNWHSVENLPYSPDTILSEQQMEEVITYGYNDVRSLWHIYLRLEKKVGFHKEAKKIFNLESFNYNDVKIGSKVLARRYKDKTGRVASGSTPRSKIVIETLVPQYFSEYVDSDRASKELKDLYGKIAKRSLIEREGKLVADNGKNFNFYTTINGVTYKMAKGGLHSVDGMSDYKASEEWILSDRDVSSLYPSYMINQELYPEHLGPEFIQAFDETKTERLNHKAKKRESSFHAFMSDILKLSINGAYGNTKNVHHEFMYDPYVTMATTIGGQLSLLMLIDMSTPIHIISANTDGVLYKVHTTQIDHLDNICKEWMEVTDLELEEERYERFYGNDVNNYLAIKAGGKTKEKGCYEVDKYIGSQPALHKDSSNRIIRIAAREYLVNGTPIEQTIRNHKNLYDFAITVRGKSSEAKGSGLYSFTYSKNGKIIETKKEKLIRYLATTRGGRVKKTFEDGSIAYSNADTPHHLFNKYHENNIKLNYPWYIKQTKKMMKLV